MDRRSPGRAEVTNSNTPNIYAAFTLLWKWFSISRQNADIDTMKRWLLIATLVSLGLLDFAIHQSSSDPDDGGNSMQSTFANGGPIFSTASLPGSDSAALVHAGTVGSVSPVCDGRKYCSQMTSCDEAKYFLKNCPDVLMNEAGDGRPCEELCGQ